MLKFSALLDGAGNLCYNDIIYQKSCDERVVNALQRCREDTAGESIPAAVLKSRSELPTERLDPLPRADDAENRSPAARRQRAGSACCHKVQCGANRHDLLRLNSGGTADDTSRHEAFALNAL